MAESLQADEIRESVIFRGRPKSMVSAAALLIAGTLTFTMGIDRLFFVEAIAWTFLIWGALLLYGHIIDIGTVYEVSDEGLAIKSPLRFWATSRKWDWGNMTRLDVIVRRREARRGRRRFARSLHTGRLDRPVSRGSSFHSRVGRGDCQPRRPETGKTPDHAELRFDTPGRKKGLIPGISSPQPCLAHEHEAGRLRTPLGALVCGDVHQVDLAAITAMH